MDITLNTDRSLIRANGGSNRYLLARFTAPESERRQERPPVNVAFVIDRSGSMGGRKIELAKEAVRAAVALLRPSDRFAIVTYDEEIDVVMPATPATAETKRRATRALENVDARGSTNLGEGWLRGAEQVALLKDERFVSRVILLTDGLANVGMVDPEELSRHAGALRSRGIRTTTIGLGEDYHEDLLRAMSLAGGGNFYHVEAARQIAKTLTSELQETLDVVARAVALELRAPEGVLVEPLTEALAERRGEAWRILLGDAVSGQDFEVVVRVNFPAGEPEREARVAVTLDDRDGTMRASGEVAWQYADHHRNDIQPRDRTVDRIVARLYAARAKQEAVALNRQGQFAAAQSAIRRVHNRIRGYAGDDRELIAIMEELKSETKRFAAQLNEVSLKHAFYESSNLMRMRTADGKARKGGPR